MTRPRKQAARIMDAALADIPTPAPGARAGGLGQREPHCSIRRRTPRGDGRGSMAASATGVAGMTAARALSLYAAIITLFCIGMAATEGLRL